ncbi:MAG: sugar transferase [Lacunisphaera sp.]
METKKKNDGDELPLPDGGVNSLPFGVRALDLACCLLGAPVLAFATLGMTLIIRCGSPGPVFFRQARIGFRGRRFMIWKFRTMKVSADTTVHQKHFKQLIETNAPMTKLDDRRDDRLIPGAWLLRASGLDELPQLLNVLSGDMSIVGPRPCVPTEYAEYSASHLARFEARPGVTGLWQVSGKNRTSFEEMIRLDIHYTRNVSLGHNLKIILLTPKALLSQMRDTLLGRKSAVAP